MKIQEIVLMKATDKILNKLINNKDLYVLPQFLKHTNMIENAKNDRSKRNTGFAQLPTKFSNEKQAQFVLELNGQLIDNKMNKAMAQLRYLNPDMYILVNELWKKEIGFQNVFKLKFVLTYFIQHLENYLSECEKRYQ